MNAEMEKERAGAYEGIKRHLRELGEKTESLSTRTTALSTALTTSSQASGNWGEVKLRRLFEMAGMSENIDFDEQTTLSDGKRPRLCGPFARQAALFPSTPKRPVLISFKPLNSIRAMNRPCC